MQPLPGDTTAAGAVWHSSAVSGVVGAFRGVTGDCSYHSGLPGAGGEAFGG